MPESTANKKQAFACLTVYIRNASINSNPAVYAKIYTAEVSQSPFFFTSDLHSGVVSIAGMESTRKTKSYMYIPVARRASGKYHTL